MILKLPCWNYLRKLHNSKVHMVQSLHVSKEQSQGKTYRKKNINTTRTFFPILKKWTHDQTWFYHSLHILINSGPSRITSQAQTSSKDTQNLQVGKPQVVKLDSKSIPI